MADLDETIRAIVREVIRDELRAELAPLRAALEAHASVEQTTAHIARGGGLSPSTLRRKIKRGEIRGRKVGRRWLVDVSSMGAPSDDQIGQLAAEARAT